MKKKKQNTNKFNRVNDFRKYDSKKAKQYNVHQVGRDEHHINYIYERNGNLYKFLSMTHNPPPDKKENYIPLTRSVNPNDKAPAFINTVSDTADYRAFGARHQGYSFSPEDEKKVAKIIKKNKKKKGK